MNKHTKKGFVQMPVQTLNALKNMLFANEGGVDFTNIINDLATDDAHRELTAIHVALAYKGVSIDIDKAPRYEKLWGNRVKKHEYIGHSLILGTIKVQTHECHIDEGSGDLIIDRALDNICQYDFGQWAEWATDVADLVKE